MKRYKKEVAFLEEIQHVPNISSACQKVGLSRNTIYRWCSEDPEFKHRLDQAMSTGGSTGPIDYDAGAVDPDKVPF